MDNKIKKGSGVLVVTIILLTVVFAFASHSSDVRPPMEPGVYVSEDIDLDRDGPLSNLQTSGLMSALDVSLEYSVEDNGIEIRIYSGDLLIERKIIDYTFANNVLIMDNGTKFMVTENPSGYQLRYPDHTVTVRRK